MQTHTSHRGAPRPCAPGGRRLDEFVGSYKKEYRKVGEQAPLYFDSLIAVFDCEDAIFFRCNLRQRLNHFGLRKLRPVQMGRSSAAACADGLFQSTASHTQHTSQGPQVGGMTHLLTDGEAMFTAIFMRQDIGLDAEDEELTCMIKLVVLFHELGHVQDYEHLARGSKRRLSQVDAEVRSHHYACRRMITGKYRIALGWYLGELQRLAESGMGPMARAARRFLRSSALPTYQNEVSPFLRYERKCS